LTVIVVSLFESVVRDHSKDHAVAVVYFNDTLTGEPYTTLKDSTMNADCRRFAALLRAPDPVPARSSARAVPVGGTSADTGAAPSVIVGERPAPSRKGSACGTTAHV
jgi:hypothetical protein